MAKKKKKKETRRKPVLCLSRVETYVRDFALPFFFFSYFSFFFFFFYPFYYISLNRHLKHHCFHPAHVTTMRFFRRTCHNQPTPNQLTITNANKVISIVKRDVENMLQNRKSNNRVLFSFFFFPHSIEDKHCR